MPRTLRRLFTLKPYGSNLLDGVAESWLLLASINIISIAFCDAIAWAYFGYTTATGWVAWVTAAIAGLVVLMLVGSVDAMFIMHDRAWRRAAQRESAETREDESLWARLTRVVHRDHIAVAARIVLVILTFTVTAPFLTQLFFARDIDANIQRRNERTVASRRTDIETGFDRRLVTLRSKIADRQRDLEIEIAGSGASGRYGSGPTAQAISRDLAALQSELQTTELARRSELEAFDRALNTPALLANRYGVDLIRQGPDTRARVIAELEQSPSFRATRLNIKAFLLFMFLGLVCLKLFQPESVRIYYNARLQAAYARMRAGLFNHRLDPREHFEVGGMSPIRFADWYENDQEVRDDTDRLRDQTASAIERLKAQEDALRALSETLRHDITRMQSELSSSSKEAEELEQQLVTCRHELNALNVKISEEQQALDDFRYDLADNLPLRDQQLLIGSRSRTVRSLADHRAAAAPLGATLQRLTQRLEAVRTYEKQLRASLSVATEESSTLNRALHEARGRRAADICAL